MTARGIAFASSFGLVLAVAMVAALLPLPAGNAATTVLPSGNLVKNPGAETPAGAPVQSNPPVFPALWQSEEGLMAQGQPGKPAQSLRYGPHQFVLTPALSAAIGGGRTFFSGGYAGHISSAFQTIDVSGAAADFGAGDVKACFSAYLGGGLEGAAAQNPTARADLQFLAEDGSALGQLGLGPVTKGHRKNAATLLWRASERAVPEQTRQLRVSLTFTGFFASGAFADNVSVALTKGRCIPQLAVRCQRGALVATVSPSDGLRTQRVRFQVRGAKGQKLANDARAPYTARVPMSGLSGRLTVTATLAQAGSGNVVLTKKSRRC
ncbi:MAG: hypothetical protein M5U27_07865 [Gaiella sp.]|nr:hypothetical protein [Gaiella sp.]